MSEPLSPETVADLERIRVAMEGRGYEVWALNRSRYDFLRPVGPNEGPFICVYFPASATSGYGRVIGAIEEVLQEIASLPDPPQLDAWTLLALRHGRQEAAYCREDEGQP
jgi:hypothetical protein